MNRLNNCEPHQRKTKLTILPYNLRQATRECVYFWSRNKDGGHTIRCAIAENPMLHANFTAMSSIEPKLLPIEVLHYMNKEFRSSLLLWPWPWPDDLQISTWPVSPEDVLADRKWTFYVRSKVIVLHGDRHTTITTPLSIEGAITVHRHAVITRHHMSADRTYEFCIHLPAGQAAPVVAARR